MSDEKQKGRVSVDVAAKAELKGEMPKETVGRLGEALADALSPFTESLGWIGDQVRYYRQDVLTKTFQKARTRVESEQIEVRPVSNKNLVPLMEAASLEEIDDERMQTLWASLLVSAATKNSIPPRFIGILRELNGNQAKALSLVMGKKHQFYGFSAVASQNETIGHSADEMQKRLQYTIDYFFVLKPDGTRKELANYVFSTMSRTCLFFQNIGMLDGQGRAEVFKNAHLGDVSIVDFDILCSLGLCEGHRASFLTNQKIAVTLSYLIATSLGGHFYDAVYSKALDTDEKRSDKSEGSGQTGVS